MRKIYKIFGIVLLIVTFLTGCGCSRGSFVVEKEAKKRESTGESWTVLVYMCASDTDKSGIAKDLLASMPYDLPENINVVVETGGCQNWQSEEIRNDRVQDFVVQKNGLRLINESLMKNMGAGDTYSEFLSRNIEKYPAEHYISVIWGNGGSPVDGVCYDANHNFDPLTVNEIAQAHGSVGKTFDIIGFDASLMSNLETATALSIYCNYLVAAEDIIPSMGWDYRGLFEYLSNYPESSAEEVGKIICDGVIAKSDDKQKKQVAMAVTDLSAATRLLQSFDGMANAMLDTTEDMAEFRNLMSKIDDVIAVGPNCEVEGYSGLVDVASLAEGVFEVTEDDSARISNAMSKAVVYVTGDSEKTGMRGINVYFPVKAAAKNVNDYRSICSSASYMDFIDRVNTNELITNRNTDYKETSAWKSYSEVKDWNSIAAVYLPTGDYSISMTNPEIVKSAYVNIYRYDEETGKYLQILTEDSTEYDPSSGFYNYKFKDVYVFKLNGTPVSANLIRKTDTCEIYSVPVFYEDTLSSIRVIKNKVDTKWEYDICGVWTGNEADSNLDREFVSLGSGSVITPAYRFFGGGESEYIKGKSIRLVFGGVNITEKIASDGDFMLSYTVCDLYGKETESNTTNVSALKGKFITAN